MVLSTSVNSAYTWWNRQATNRDQLYPDFLLFVSASILPQVSSKRYSSRPQSHYDDDQTKPNSCSSKWRKTYIQTHALLPGTPVLYAPATSLFRSKLRVQQMFWMGTHEMFRSLKCGTVSENSRLDLQSPPPTPAPFAEQSSDDNTFYSSTLMKLATD